MVRFDHVAYLINAPGIKIPEKKIYFVLAEKL